MDRSTDVRHDTACGDGRCPTNRRGSCWRQPASRRAPRSVERPPRICVVANPVRSARRHRGGRWWRFRGLAGTRDHRLLSSLAGRRTARASPTRPHPRRRRHLGGRSEARRPDAHHDVAGSRSAAGLVARWRSDCVSLGHQRGPDPDGGWRRWYGSREDDPLPSPLLRADGLVARWRAHCQCVGRRRLDRAHSGGR